jgi:hypothetical protein
MRDVELYGQILGLSAPWTAAGVELDVEARRVEVCVERGAGVRWRCPHCERELPIYDHSEERTWRHCTSSQVTSSGNSSTSFRRASFTALFGEPPGLASFCLGDVPAA